MTDFLFVLFVFFQKFATVWINFSTRVYGGSIPHLPPHGKPNLQKKLKNESFLPKKAKERGEVQGNEVQIGNNAAPEAPETQVIYNLQFTIDDFVS